MTTELTSLENRLLDLEFKQLKNKLGWTRTSVRAIQSTSASKKVPLEMRVSRRPGAEKYELRTAAGWITLSADRKSWPADARNLQAQVDEFDKRRRVGGRLISTTTGTAGLG